MFLDKQIMISEGSCDTEDWSNNTENSALYHRNKLLFIIYSNRKNNITVFFFLIE